MFALCPAHPAAEEQGGLTAAEWPLGEITHKACRHQICLQRTYGIICSIEQTIEALDCTARRACNEEGMRRSVQPGCH
jgi:hypothetical protein